MIITDIQRIRGHLVQLSFDDAPDVQIDLRVWEESSLKAGSSLSEEELKALLELSRQTRAREKALYLLSKRDYSKKELTDRLCREKGRYQSDRTEAAAAVASRMEELGLVNDEAYAARLARDYQLHRLYPRRRAIQELCGKGIGRELAEEAVEGTGIADADLALQCCAKNTIISCKTPTTGAEPPRLSRGRAFHTTISAVRSGRRRRTFRRKPDRNPGKAENAWQHEKVGWAWFPSDAPKTRWTRN